MTKKTLNHREKVFSKTGIKLAFRTNWQDHFPWQDILAAQKEVGWSAAAIVNYRYRLKPDWYLPQPGKPGGLYRQTVAKWFEPDGNGGHRWTDAVLERARRGRLGATGRSKALVGY